MNNEILEALRRWYDGKLSYDDLTKHFLGLTYVPLTLRHALTDMITDAFSEGVSHGEFISSEGRDR